MAEPFIPAWLITVLAFMAAWALWLVRPMPRLIRISIIVPMLYFGLLYLVVGYATLPEVIKATLVRIGLVAIFVPIIINALLVRWENRNGRRL